MSHHSQDELPRFSPGCSVVLVHQSYTLCTSSCLRSTVVTLNPDIRILFWSTRFLVVVRVLSFCHCYCWLLVCCVVVWPFSRISVDIPLTTPAVAGSRGRTRATLSGSPTKKKTLPPRTLSASCSPGWQCREICNFRCLTPRLWRWVSWWQILLALSAASKGWVAWSAWCCGDEVMWEGQQHPDTPGYLSSVDRLLTVLWQGEGIH